MCISWDSAFAFLQKLRRVLEVSIVFCINLISPKYETHIVLCSVAFGPADEL